MPAVRSLAVAVVALTLVAGVVGAASARRVIGTAAGETLRGGNGPDLIDARGGRDRLVGLGGADVLAGGTGRDVVIGGAGRDAIAAENDGARDTVACGGASDVVTADARDRVSADCEVVSVRLSRDPYRNANAQHETQVEPDSFSVGSTIVTTFQSGRFPDGASTNIGFAASRNGGRTWRSGFLPGLTVHSRPAGPAQRVSDPAVAYEAVRRVWLIASLSVAEDTTRLLVSRSRDGVRWSRPVVAARAPPPRRGIVAFDKEWIACDNWRSSRFRGRCYLTYTDATARNRLVTQFSRDGGRTWSDLVPTAPPEGVGAFPVVRPNGDLLVVYSDWQATTVVRSLDGGSSFSAPARIATHPTRRLRTFRTFQLPSADVDRSGRVYVVWHDCRFRPDCRATDVVLATSADGVSWSAPVRVPTTAITSPRAHHMPAIAVDPATSGRRARLRLAYYTLSNGECDPCTVDVATIASRDGGRTWGRQQRLNARAMRLTWIARTTLGRMLADYISVSWSRGRAVTVFALASEPRGGLLRQSIFATRPR